MRQACGEVGLRLPVNPLPTLTRRSAHDQDVPGAFRTLLGQAGGKKPDLVVCFLAPKNTHYSAVKRFGDLSAGVPTQCLNLGKMRKMNMAYFANVALKVNIKLSGINFSVDPADLPGFGQSPTIVFGADVTHPGPGSLAPSVAAVVASWDSVVRTYTRISYRIRAEDVARQAANYQAETRIQSSREEIISELAAMCTTLLRNFYAKNGNKPPQRIIFFRDGLSEGQYSEVRRGTPAKA